MSDSHPRYIAKTFHKEADLATGNSNLDGTTGTYVTVHTWTSLANEGKGGLIDSLGFKAAAATTAGMVRVFINDDLKWELIVAAVTPAAATKSAEGFIDETDENYGHDFPFACKPGDVVKVSTEQSEAIKFWMNAGAYSDKESV